ncbi:GNAT family N-acetyltransferase [Vibrio penaeicida]|uniref:GNAT family N-acetyltransferase n=1 Tax=Vibrio penaeicida TaxID=104609 RepID=UPI00273745A8|nr:GNAT family N-acetyltransferase [Vibrio penaeicida]MDP2571713.1 GNAT family N-acetyltransferase [Vibrio penaeicida]
MEVRRIRSTDLESFFALWQGVFDEGIYLRSPPPPKEKISFVLSKIEEKKIPQFVAEIDGKIVGSIEAFPGTMCGMDSDDIGFVGAQVHADFRRLGIGRKLLDTVILDSKRFGYKELNLEVYCSNLPAQKLYQAFGFEYSGQANEVTLPSGKTEQSSKMRLII